MKKIRFVFTILIAFSIMAVFSLTACKDSGNDDQKAEITHAFEFVVEGPSLNVPVYFSFTVTSPEHVDYRNDVSQIHYIVNTSTEEFIPTFPYKKTFNLEVTEEYDYNYSTFTTNIGLHYIAAVGVVPFDFKPYTLKIFFDGTEIANATGMDSNMGNVTLWHRDEENPGLWVYDGIDDTRKRHSIAVYKAIHINEDGTLTITEGPV